MDTSEGLEVWLHAIPSGIAMERVFTGVELRDLGVIYLICVFWGFLVLYVLVQGFAWAATFTIAVGVPLRTTALAKWSASTS